MQTSSSAKRTCSESRSASLYTATVRMPISRQARITRSATSPRFAIRIFLNMGLRAVAPLPMSSARPSRPVDRRAETTALAARGPYDCRVGEDAGGGDSGARTGRLDPEQDLPVLHGLRVLDQDLPHDP